MSLLLLRLMSAKISNVRVDESALHPTLIFFIELSYYSEMEIPLSFSGTVKVGGKVISYLEEHKIPSSLEVTHNLKALTDGEKKKRQSTNNQSKYVAELIAQLDQRAIDFIEAEREKDSEKAVKFNLDIIIKHLELPGYTTTASPKMGDVLLVLKSTLSQKDYSIPQSDWINRFSSKLGIGNFLLLEVQIPNKYSVEKEWIDLYDRLYQRVKEMEDAIRKGDWSKVLFTARQFFEVIKLGDGKPNHIRYENQLKELFLKDQHSERGFKNFLDAIWQFFEFISKFIHDKDKEGQLNPVPIPTKEDAYFAYALSIGLLNIVGKKLSK